MLVRVVDDESGEEVIPEQALPALPGPGSLIKFQESYRVIDAPPAFEFRCLPNGRVPRWVIALRARRIDNTAAA